MRTEHMCNIISENNDRTDNLRSYITNEASAILIILRVQNDANTHETLRTTRHDKMY